jgi:hypothetical protein
LLASDVGAVLDLDGSFALVAQDGERVVLARSLDRPLRYFLAKAVDGPALIVAERIDSLGDRRIGTGAEQTDAELWMVGNAPLMPGSR